MTPELLKEFPRPQSIFPGQILCILEDMFVPSTYRVLHAGKRQTVAEVMENSGSNVIDGFARIKVFKSEGYNALPFFAMVDRPIINLLNSYDLTEYKGNAETHFKSGGQTSISDFNIKQGSEQVGGYLVGKSHAEGGIKMKTKDGRGIEMEGGEVVITKPAVEDNSKREFEGQMLTNREILSKINVSGGGVSFEKGGDVPGSCRCSGKEYKFGGKTMSDFDIVKNINDCGCTHSLEKAIEEEKKDNYYTLAKLNAGSITIEDALKEIAKTRLQNNSGQYN